MPNTDQNNNEIISQYYSENNRKGLFSNNLILAFSVVIFAGTIGYLLGVNNTFAKISDLLTPASGSSQLQELSDQELDQLIDGSAYDFKLYTQIIGNLKKLYVDPEAVNDKNLFDGTLKWLVGGIGDRNTVYMNSDDYKKYKDSLSGAFEGIGVRLKYNSSGRVEIGGVIPNSPAEKQKLYPGLIFDKVDGVSVQSKNAEEITELVRGKEGTKVQIEFIDPSNGQLKKYEIERANIKVESIRIIEKNSDTVVLEVNRFTESTPQIWQQLWDTKINEINSNGYKNVILDLRDNGGGYLSAAIYAAGDFMPNGKLIVTEKTRSGGDKTQVTSNAKQRLSGKNVVILVNENTASASEILAAALRYHNKTKIIGQKTFGKGTVQNIFELSNGGALKITIEYWLMPDGKKLNAENPIVPDQISILNRERQLKGEDNMMEDALEVINKL